MSTQYNVYNLQTVAFIEELDLQNYELIGKTVNFVQDNQNW